MVLTFYPPTYRSLVVHSLQADVGLQSVQLHRQRRVHGNRGTVSAHRDTAHHLDTAGDITIARAAFDLVGSKVHGFHAGGTETVDGQTGDTLVQIGRQHR